MSQTIKGSCMCQGIQFEYTGTPDRFSYCHCKMCQKFSGGAFGAFITLKRKDLHYIKGEELRKEYSSSEWASRVFCSICGSSLEYIYHEMPEDVSISAGLFDEDPKIRASRHIFVKDKCKWFEITDKIEQIARY